MSDSLLKTNQSIYNRQKDWQKWRSRKAHNLLRVLAEPNWPTGYCSGDLFFCRPQSNTRRRWETTNNPTWGWCVLR